MSPKSAHISDQDLCTARDKWKAEDWESHFRRIGVEPSPVRYDVGGANDVLRYALNTVQQGRCWLQGSISCQSRALLLSQAEIDHVVPQESTPDQLRKALARSTYQVDYFDVHDPGNLAIACHSCNREKRTWSPGTLHRKRIEEFESQRDSVIRRWKRWHRQARVDDATLKALAGVGLEDIGTREVYAEIIATMIMKLAEASGLPASLRGGQEVKVESESLRFMLGPSDQMCEWLYEDLQEMMAEERRLERKYGL